MTMTRKTTLESARGRVDGRSAEAAEYRKLYDTARWKRLREAVRAEQPLCVMCLRDDVVTEADVVDHIKPHHGDHLLFFDMSNLQPLCKQHHDRDKQQMERGTYIEFGPDGWPVE